MTEWTTIGVPVELHQAIAELARRQDRKISAIVKRAIADYSESLDVEEV